MDKKRINTIEMTRKIRDEHIRRLAGKSRAERIAFYRERAKKAGKENSRFTQRDSKDLIPLRTSRFKIMISPTPHRPAFHPKCDLRVFAPLSFSARRPIA